MKYTTSLLLVILLIASCSKNEKKSSRLDTINGKKSFAASADGSSDIMDYYTFIASPANGTFGITASSTDYTTTASQSIAAPVTLGGGFYGAENQLLEGGSITFGGVTLNPNAAHGNYYGLESSAIADPSINDFYSQNGYIDYSLFAGQTIPVSIHPEAGGDPSEKGAEGQLYIPQSIRMDKRSMPFFTDDLGNSVLAVSSLDNTSFQWNADANNNKGVVIIIEYDPTLKANLDYLDTDTPAESRRLYTAVRVPDNGQYSFTPDDLQGLPSNCMAVVTIGRAEYATFNDKDGSSTYAVYAATAVSAMCRISACPASVTTPCTE